jgi:hypothetical protein
VLGTKSEKSTPSFGHTYFEHTQATFEPPQKRLKQDYGDQIHEQRMKLQKV